MMTGGNAHGLPEEILGAISAVDLPPMPQILLRLLQAVENERVSMEELTTLVSQDVGLAARVVAAANSPALGRGTRMASIEDCLVVLGTRVVRSMATCLAVQRMFDGETQRERRDFSGFWRHSLFCAELARSLALACAHPRPDEAYLAGLLHDVGQILLLSALKEGYGALLPEARDETDLLLRERAGLGTDHAEVGAWMVDRWQLDSSLADSILFHHATATSIPSADLLARIVWSAHRCVSDGAETAGDVPLPDAARERLPRLRGEAEDRTRLIARALGIPLAGEDEEVGPTDFLPRVEFSGGGQAETTDAGADAAAELDRTVAGLALMQPLQRDLAALEDEAELLTALREAARILFGLGVSAFLLFDRERGVLAGSAGQPIVLREASLAPEGDASIIQRSLRRGRPLCSLDTPDDGAAPSLIDRQFARALAGEGLLCVPLAAGERLAGVLVAGVGAVQYARLKPRLPWLDSFGRLAASCLLAWQDVRERERQAGQEQSNRYLRHARRISHEAGNPLGIIKGYLKILDARLAADPEIQGELAVLGQEIDRVSSIVRRLSEFPADEGRAATGVNDLVGELLGLYGKPLFRDREMSFSLVLAEREIVAACGRDVLKQILLNLAKNASEAMGPGGHFEVVTRDRVFVDGEAHGEIVLRDSGPGLPAEAAARLKGDAEALARDGPRGVGLAIVGALARKAGIRISCHAEAGRGTEIVLLLPLKSVLRPQ